MKNKIFLFIASRNPSFISQMNKYIQSSEARERVQIITLEEYDGFSEENKKVFKEPTVTVIDQEMIATHEKDTDRIFSLIIHHSNYGVPNDCFCFSSEATIEEIKMGFKAMALTHFMSRKIKDEIYISFN